MFQNSMGEALADWSNREDACGVERGRWGEERLHGGPW